MKLAYYLTIFLFCCKKLHSQQFNNWVFHNNNGLTFNTNPPSFFPNTQISIFAPYYSAYSTASISDNNGQLLFYSDGERVWNKNNQLMPNGFGLSGGEGQINTILIIPFINDTSKYYLFTSKGLTFYAPGDESTYPYCYSVVDMQLNGGLGDVVSKNTFIKFFANEKMVAIPNANGNDIWWICRDWSNNFYSYKITCQGLQNNNPAISTVGNNVNGNVNYLSAGDIKASPDGRYIAACYRDYFEIYRFNSATGILSNPIFLPVNTIGSGCYGIEFSPNSKFLYVTGVENIGNAGFGFLKQYNLSNYDSTAISNSSYNVSNLYTGGGLQLGPDNKIYHNATGDKINVIDQPNIQGAGCSFQDSVITLPDIAFGRFPYTYVNLITSQTVQISYAVAADCRTVNFLAKTYIKGNNLTFKWKWGELPPVGGTAADSATKL